MNPLCLVLVGSRYNLDNLVTRELKLGDVHRAAMHEVGVKHTQDRLVRDDEQVVLFALELENDGFETDGKVMV